MPVLSNARHERFAQELAKGKTACQAYEDAGYAPSTAHSSRLAAKGSIIARVTELQTRAAARTEVTVASLLAEAEEVRLAAMKAEQFAPAIAAVREKGVLSGKRIERAERGGPGDFSRMTDEELDVFIAQTERELRGLLGGARAESEPGLAPGGRRTH